MKVCKLLFVTYLRISTNYRHCQVTLLLNIILEYPCLVDVSNMMLSLKYNFTPGWAHLRNKCYGSNGKKHGSKSHSTRNQNVNLNFPS